jgi:hypothetical protein
MLAIADQFDALPLAVEVSSTNLGVFVHRRRGGIGDATVPFNRSLSEIGTISHTGGINPVRVYGSTLAV